MKIETLAIHAGRAPDPATGAVREPIHLSTTFERGADGGFPHGFEYVRDANPNRRMLEECLRALEGGAEAIAFASGSAAAKCLVDALPPELPRRVLVCDDIYFGIRELLAEHGGFEVLTVDMTDLQKVRRLCRKSAIGLVWLESPTNPLAKVIDIARMAEIAHDAGARLVVDNSWATPVLQQPLALGADLVVHSLTKYIGGHSDLMAGMIVSRAQDDHATAIRRLQKLNGAVPSPFDCWLALRGVQSLPYRVRAHCGNAQAVAIYLDRHPAVARVHYPGLADNPGNAVARQQMRGYGGILSFQVHGGAAEAMAVAAAVTLIARGTSFGGTHTLIEHRASIEGPGSPVPTALLRLSVGIESAEELLADLAQALHA